MAPTAYSLTVKIASSDLQNLIQNKFSLYLSRQFTVNGQPVNDSSIEASQLLSVVEHGKLSGTLTFTWNEEVQVYLQQQIVVGFSVDDDLLSYLITWPSKDRVVVITETASFSAIGGETITFDTSGKVTATSGTNPSSFTIVNNWKGGARVGLKIKHPISNGSHEGWIDVQLPTQQVLGLTSNVEVTALPKLSLYFESKTGNQSMIVDVKSEPFEVEMKTKKVQLQYRGKEWNQVSTPQA
jgi:hypothetical protein